jgi:hypothetical protein
VCVQVPCVYILRSASAVTACNRNSGYRGDGRDNDDSGVDGYGGDNG